MLRFSMATGRKSLSGLVRATENRNAYFVGGLLPLFLLLVVILIVYLKGQVRVDATQGWSDKEFTGTGGLRLTLRRMPRWGGQDL